MTSVRWLIVAVVCTAASLSGCSEPEEERAYDCGFSISTAPPGAIGASVNRSLLNDHPTLSELLDEAPQALQSGIGRPVDCAEGDRAMTALREMGANITEYDSGTKETILRMDGADYRLLMARSVAG